MNYKNNAAELIGFSAKFLAPVWHESKWRKVREMVEGFTKTKGFSELKAK